MKLSEILRSKGIVFFQTDRLSLDNYYYEPFQDRDEEFDKNRIFETDKIKDTRKVNPTNHSLFKYFIDGSRKTYKIGDIITTDNKFVPAVAGQIGAVCCFRNKDRKLNLFDIKKRNILMLYDSIQDLDFERIKELFEKQTSSRVLIEVEKYSYDKMKDDAPTNAAVAALQKNMRDLEIMLLMEMVKSKTLNTDEMLVIDGSLQFLTQKFDPNIFYNVVGISKSFNPNLTGILKGKTHIGVLLAKLEFGERTAVFKYDTKKYAIGAWYLRIRERKNVRDPLGGVVKIEKMALQENLEMGFNSSLIDNISASILAERNPTCHGNDDRWPNHLYPIYLTERILKASFLSDYYFMNLF